MIQEDLLGYCPDAGVFADAIKLYETETFDEVFEKFDDELECVIVEMQFNGSHGKKYDAWLAYDFEGNEIIDYGCSCQTGHSYMNMCKHSAALGMYWMERLNQKETVYEEMERKTDWGIKKTDWEIKALIQDCVFKEHLKQQKARGDIELEAEMTDYGMDYRGNRKWFLTFKIGNTRKYVLKNLSDFVDHIHQEEVFSYGKQLSFLHSKSAFTEKAWKYVELIEAADSMYSNSYDELRKELPLNNQTLEMFLMINLGQKIPYTTFREKGDYLYVLDKDPAWKLVLQSYESGYILKVPPIDYIECPKEFFIKEDNRIYRCSEAFKKVFGYMMPLVDTQMEMQLAIAKEDMPAFCRVVVPVLKPSKILDIGDLDLDQYQPVPIEIAFYLDEGDGRVTAKVTGKYGDKENNLLFDRTMDAAFYDVVSEQRALDVAQAYFPEIDRKKGEFYFLSKDEDRFYQLLSTGLSQMHGIGEVYATERIKGRRILSSPATKIGVAIKSGLLELTLDTEIDRGELAGLLEQYQKRKKYYRLKNGDFLSLQDSSMETVAELLAGLNLKKGELEKEVLEVPVFRACYIDRVLKDQKEQLRVERNTDYKAVIRSMNNVADSDYAEPESLVKILREYQKTGYQWLRTLADLGFGGILADDMGLGKTLQTIAYFLGKKQEGSKGISLIVCPASLVYNWAKELEQFAPELSVALITGNMEVRREQMQKEQDRDVWITSYDLLKRDISAYQDLKFETEVLDEAQNIKNQGTQAAKAVKRIRAGVRFALTGTPIENRLSELWSIFDYLMPGILGTYEQFRKTYEIPIVHEGRKETAERLQKMVSPFILRRLKADVLKELPEKTEQVVCVQMEEEQRQIYLAHTEQMRQMLECQSEEEVRTQKLKILAELTRLRQVCCAPQLLYENYRKMPCKVTACMELLKEAVQAEHKVLIFSQFPSIFTFLEQWLLADKIAYYVLTGDTSKEKRLSLVEKFNKDEIPVFLISLKAGGTGLNLTGASIVIHFDPWWNLAAQNQATDRVHRIGQKNPVMVYKLIAKNSIEEKIIELQEKKKELADQILEGEGLSAASLTKEDLLEILESR